MKTIYRNSILLAFLLAGFLYLKEKAPYAALAICSFYWFERTKDRSVIIVILYLLTFLFRNTPVPEETVLEGRVTRTSVSYALVHTDAGNVVVYQDQFLPPDCIVRCTGNVEPPQEKNSFYGFDEKSWFRSVHVVGKISDGEITVLSQKKTMRYLIFERIGEFPLTEQQILYRILLNITTDRNDRSFLTETGISYTGILLVLNELLAYFTGEKRKKRIMCIITCCMAVLYDFPPVLIQQVIFRILSFTDTERKRQTGIGLVLMMTIDPACINTVSFLLPAVYRLSSCFPENSRIMPVMITSMIQSVKYHLVNPLQIILFPVLRRLTGWLWIFCLMQLFLPFPFVSAFYLLDHLFRIMNYADLPSDIRGPGLLLFLPLVYVMRKCRKSALISLCLLYVFMYAGLFHPFAEVTCINVGQGDCILIRMPMNLNNILIDTGKPAQYRSVQSYLNARGIRHLDGLIITHQDDDHCGNQFVLEEEYHPDVFLRSHQEHTVIKGLHFYDLNDIDDEDENRSSIVMYTQIGGLKYLFTGDADQVTEERIIRRFPKLRCDVLKLSHHGSKTRSCDLFLDTVRPVLGLICSGPYSMYHHPSPETIQRLLKRHIPYLDTKEEGDIRILYIGPFRILQTSSGRIGLLHAGE